METRKRLERVKNYCNLVANPFHPENMHGDLALLIPYQVRSQLPTTEKIKELEPGRNLEEEIIAVSESSKYQQQWSSKTFKSDATLSQPYFLTTSPFITENPNNSQLPKEGVCFEKSLVPLWQNQAFLESLNRFINDDHHLSFPMLSNEELLLDS